MTRLKPFKQTSTNRLTQRRLGQQSFAQPVLLFLPGRVFHSSCERLIEQVDRSRSAADPAGEINLRKTSSSRLRQADTRRSSRSTCQNVITFARLDPQPLECCASRFRPHTAWPRICVHPSSTISRNVGHVYRVIPEALSGSSRGTSGNQDPPQRSQNVQGVRLPAQLIRPEWRISPSLPHRGCRAGPSTRRDGSRPS